VETDKMCLKCEHLKEQSFPGIWGRTYTCSLNPVWMLIRRPLIQYCGHWKKSETLVAAEETARSLAKWGRARMQIEFPHKVQLISIHTMCKSFKPEEVVRDTQWRKLWKILRLNRR